MCITHEVIFITENRDLASYLISGIFRAMFRKVTIGLVLCLIWGAASTAILQAQDPRFSVERIMAEDGQPLSAIYSVMQDSHGYIWFGTVSGLERYDGYGFRSYRYDAFNPTGLSGYKVTSIVEDSSGYIWAGTLTDGLNRLDRRTDKFTHFIHNPLDLQSLSGSKINALITDRFGNVWIATDKGLDRFNKRTGKIERYAASRVNGRSFAQPTSLFVDRVGQLWVCSRGGYSDGSSEEIGTTMSVYDEPTDSFRTWTLSTTERRDTRILGNGPDGTLELGFLSHGNRNNADPDFLRRFDPKTGSVYILRVATSIEGSTRAKYALTVDREGNCWYASIAGSKSSQGYHPHYSVYCEPPDRLQAGSAPQPPITTGPIITGLPITSFQDRTGTMWIGMEDGLVRISRIGSGITTWRHDPNNPTTLSDLRIRSVLRSRQGALWVSTDYGLNRYDEATGGWKRFFAGDTTRGALPNSTVNVIYQDTDGTMFFGTNGGLVAYDERRGRFYDPLPRLRQLDGARPIVWSILRDRKGLLWIGTRYEGLAQCGADGNLIQWFRHDPNDHKSLLASGVWSMLEDRRGNIWASTDEGLCRFIPEEKAFRRYVHQKGNNRSLCGTRVWSTYEDHAGDIWATSFGGGVSRYNKETDDFTNITSKDGLVTNSVVGLLEDDAGALWIATTQGLVRWQAQNNRFKLYDRGDGLQGNEFTFKAFCKDANGRLYFGGINGLSTFHPMDLRDNTRVPPIVITGFRIFDRLTTEELYDRDTVRLDHSENFFSFEFSALNYINPGKNQYAYRLDGVDPSWVTTTSNRRLASYTGLAPGVYTFQVRGSNNDGVWNESGIVITVIIEPPWWGTWTFRGIVGLLAIILTVVGIRIRTHVVRKHEQEKTNSAVQATLESQEAERQRIARDLHDGIGQLLAAAGINLTRLRDTIIRRAATDKDAAELLEPLDKTEWILHRTTKDVRTLSHALGISTLQELGLTAALGELISNISGKEETRFDLVAVGLDGRLAEPIEIGLFRIAQELIANVLRHADATEASVQIMQEGDELRLTVEDNGIGFDMSTAQAGMGLRNIAARAAAIGGELHYDSNVGQGTTVTVVVRHLVPGT